MTALVDCPACDGVGELVNDVDYPRVCSWCDGAGEVTVESAAAHAERLADREDA